MKKPLLIRIIASLLVILYFYTSVSKALDYPEFERQMRNQALPAWSAHLIVWLLPPVEIVVVLLLLASGTRLSGFYLSTMLMLGFTTYIGLVLTGFFDRRPCSCGA